MMTTVDQPQQPQSINCPNCGYAVDVGSPICGNCGQTLGAYESATPIAARGGGGARGLIVLIIVLVIGGAIWGATAKIVDVFQRMDVDEITGVSEPRVLDVEAVESPYKSVPALVNAINKGGLRCKDTKVDHADEYVATGSCQAPGDFPVHVQINIFFERTSLDAVEEQMGQGPFNYLHDANWFVISQPETLKKIHKILGGKLSPG